MARYIDLEELERRIKKHVKPEIPEEKAFVEYYKDECIRQGYAMPTADVVPKTEVDKLEQDVTRLVQENEALKDSNEHLAVLLSEAKAEVAREIFEEIENAKYTILGLQDIVSMGDIEELKKKYTEQCPKCKHFVGCECFDGKTCDEYEEGEK